MQLVATCASRHPVRRHTLAPGVTRARPIRPDQRDDRRRAQGRRSLKRDFGEVANLQVSLKGPANFVSAADHRAEEILRAELLKARPGYGFLGEEGGIHEGTDKTHTWVVDPLDGTTNFLHGIPHFAISIALEREGVPIAGLIYNPANDEFFTAERGKGAFLQRSPHPRRGAQAARRGGRVLRAAAPRARRSRAVPPRDGRRSRTRSRGCGASARPRSISPMWRPDASTPIGSAGSPPGTSRPASLVREAGGFVTDLEDNERTMEAGDVIAGNECMHRQVLTCCGRPEMIWRRGESRSGLPVLPRLCHHCGRFMGRRPSEAKRAAHGARSRSVQAVLTPDLPGPDDGVPDPVRPRRRRAATSRSSSPSWPIRA